MSRPPLKSRQLRSIRNYEARKRRRRPFTPLQTQVIKKIIDKKAEQKYIDTELDAIHGWYGATAQQQCITLCAQGDTDVTRTGNNILVHSMQMNTVLRGDPLCTSDVLCRIIIYRALDCNGANPTATEVLNAVDVKAFRNKTYMGDYRVLYDRIKLLPQGSISSQANTPFRSVKYYKRFKKPLKVTYDDTSALIGSCERNHLFVMLISSWGADAYSPICDSYFRVRFTDA